MARRYPTYRCGNCQYYPGRNKVCYDNTRLYGSSTPVTAESYSCGNFRRAR